MKLEELFAPYSPPETNFLDRLSYWAAALPEKIAYRFIAGDGEIKTLTFAELDHRAKAVAAMLVSKGYAGKRAKPHRWRTDARSETAAECQS